jgi:hypothetical protein
MPYDFTAPTATEHQLEEPAAADGNLRAKVGHPVTVYSQETAERVCELIATGHNLRQIEAMRATEPDLQHGARSMTGSRHGPTLSSLITSPSRRAPSFARTR